MSVRSYRDLDVWQLAMDVVVDVYKQTGQLPSDERYGLASQMQRAAVSVPSNIAEGHARDSTREFLRFISIALGSLAELETQIRLIKRLNLPGASSAHDLLQKTASVGRMLRRLQQSLRNKRAAQSPVPSPQSLSEGSA